MTNLTPQDKLSLNKIRIGNNNWRGTPLSLDNGGTGSSLTPPAGDRILFYDQSAASTTFLSLSADLTISGTTLGLNGGSLVSDGDKGDIVVASGGSTWTIDSGVVSTSKLGGDITTQGKALLDDSTAADQRTTLGLGTLATQSGTFSGTSSGTNTGDQNLFSTIAVSGQSNIVADSTGDTLTIAAGSGITLTTDAATDTLTITNSGSASNTFSTIAVSGQSDVVADSGTDTLTLVAGSNITLTTDAATDSITISSSGGGGNSFSTIAVSGQSDVVADSSSDTLTLVAGSNITLTTNAGSDTITISASSTSSTPFGSIGLLSQGFICI